MFKNISMTDVLKKPSQIRKYVEKGFILHVFYNNNCVFDITPPKKIKNKQSTDLPPKLNLNKEE